MNDYFNTIEDVNEELDFGGFKRPASRINGISQGRFKLIEDEEEIVFGRLGESNQSPKNSFRHKQTEYKPLWVNETESTKETFPVNNDEENIRHRIEELEKVALRKPEISLKYNFAKGILRFIAFIVFYFGATFLLQRVFGETSIPVVAAAIVIIMYFNPWAIIAFLVTAPFGLWDALLTLLSSSNAYRAMDVLQNSPFVKSGIGEPFYIAVMIIGVALQPYFFKMISYFSLKRIYKKDRKKALKEIKRLKAKLRKNENT